LRSIAKENSGKLGKYLRDAETRRRARGFSPTARRLPAAVARRRPGENNSAKLLTS
jgi:hypothetical protein